MRHDRPAVFALRTPLPGIGATRRGHVPTRAIALITCAVLCFTIGDAITKFTTQHYGVPMLVFARYIVQFVAMLAWLGPRMGRRLLVTKRPRVQVFRGMLRAALIGIAAAIFYAGYQVTTRMLAGEDPLVLLFYPALIGTLILTALAPAFDWPAAMPWTHVLLVVCVGLFATAGHFLFILAFRLAPASALTPFTYVQLVFAMLLGFLLYGNFPNGLRIAGMALIAGSGLVTTLHERRRARSVGDPVTIQ